MGAVVAVLAVTATRADALPLLTHQGRWLVDQQGRVVILHGVQVDRFMPGTSVEGWIDVPPAGARFIAGQGFNLARVSLAYAGVEPQPGRFDGSYLRPFLGFDQELAQAGVYDLIDMMQGQYSAAVGGGGFPNWMTITDGAPNVERPFPQGYLVNPAEERAWDNFYANTPASDGVGLQDHYATGLRYLARSFLHQPGFLGFDLINEPWPGSQWPTCANPAGCPVFDQSLNAFYRRILPALRADDPTHLVFYEPHPLFDDGAATNLGSIADPNAVFTFHNYCLGDQPGFPQSDPGQNCGVEEQMVLGNAEKQAGATGDALLEDEWGNSPSVPLLQRMAAEADQHMVGWAYWAYEDCCQSPGAIVADGAKDPSAPGNLNLPVLSALVRPYPQLISGTPTPWTYEPQTRQFSLTYSTERAGVTGAAASGPSSRFPAGSPTEVFVPQLQYPHGYRVSVSGATVASPPTSGRLLLCSQAGAATVSVALTPDQGSTTDLLPPTSSPPTCPASSAQSAASAGATTSLTPGGLGLSLSHGGSTIAVGGVLGVTLPPTTRCVSRRRFAIRLSRRPGVRLLGVRATVGGRRVAVRGGRHPSRNLVLRHLPAGAFTLHLLVRFRYHGHTYALRASRAYHSCARGRRRLKVRPRRISPR